MNGARILIIEHDPAMVVLFEDMLADAGYHTDVWPYCAGAVEHIRHAQPQGVLLSLWLEERGDGWKDTPCHCACSAAWKRGASVPRDGNVKWRLWGQCFMK